MTGTIQGGCACGAVRYELATAPADAGWCHCRICQLTSGAPAMVFASVPAGDFRFLRGEDQVGRFQSSEVGHRWYCRGCGTPLAMEPDEAPKTIDFSVATLDDPGSVAPGFHIFTDSRIKWFDPVDGLPRYPRHRTPPTD